MRQVQLKTVKAREKQNVNVKAQTTYENKNIQKQTAIKQTNYTTEPANESQTATIMTLTDIAVETP